MNTKMLFCISILLCSFLGCTKKSDPEHKEKGKSEFTFENKKENLRKLFEEMHQCAHGGDVKRGAKLCQSLYPSEDQIKSVIRDGVDPAMVQQVLDRHKSYVFPDNFRTADIASAFVNDRKKTVVKVHAATTEELIEGSAASEEFPGGAKIVAQAMLKEGVTFYEVELLEPGKRWGMTYHLFFWNGSSWSMFGAAWRAIH